MTNYGTEIYDLYFCSLRAQFALADVPINQLHGSQTQEEAQKEIETFFGPVEQTLAVIKPDAYSNKGENSHISVIIVFKMCSMRSSFTFHRVLKVS